MFTRLAETCDYDEEALEIGGPSMLGEQPPWWARGNNPPVRQNRHVIALPFGPEKVMGRNQDRAPASAEACQDVPQCGRGIRIQSPEGLIQDDDLGFMAQRGDDLKLPAHSMGVLPDLLVEVVSETEEVGQLSRPRPVFAPPHRVMELEVFLPSQSHWQGKVVRRKAVEITRTFFGDGDSPVSTTSEF